MYTVFIRAHQEMVCSWPSYRTTTDFFPMSSAPPFRRCSDDISPPPLPSPSLIMLTLQLLLLYYCCSGDGCVLLRSNLLNETVPTNASVLQNHNSPECELHERWRSRILSTYGTHAPALSLALPSLVNVGVLRRGTKSITCKTRFPNCIRNVLKTEIGPIYQHKL